MNDSWSTALAHPYTVCSVVCTPCIHMKIKGLIHFHFYVAFDCIVQENGDVNTVHTPSVILTPFLTPLLLIL